MEKCLFSLGVAFNKINNTWKEREREREKRVTDRQGLSCFIIET